MPTKNLRTLALDAAKAKVAVLKATEKLTDLTKKLIDKAGGGATFHTDLGMVIVTEETVDRNGRGFIYVFDPDAFEKLDPLQQGELAKAGVVVAQKIVIKGQPPKVQFRLTEKA